MKKKFGAIAILIGCILMATTSALASQSMEDLKSDKYLYYIDGVQVAEEDYPLSVQPYNEQTEEANEVSIFDYYIVSPDGIEAVSEEEYYAVIKEQLNAESRTKGSWSIRGSVIDPEETRYYFKSSGEDFDVASDEAIELRINEANHNRYFTVGCTGTSYFDAPISVPSGRIPVIGFVDSIDRPGTYRVLIKNNGEKTETVNGVIKVVDEEDIDY